MKKLLLLIAIFGMISFFSTKTVYHAGGKTYESIGNVPSNSIDIQAETTILFGLITVSKV
jgi:hypothetical protein